MNQGLKEKLSPLEKAVLALLKKNPGTVVSREEMLTGVWGFPEAVDTRMVDMCVTRLRRKIGADHVRTVYGKGYMLVL